MPEAITQAMRALAGPQDPHAQAVQGVQQRYPNLMTRVPMVATTGSGPYHSETYLPWASENPLPGKLNIQLRSDKGMTGRPLEDALTTESFHYLGAEDPTGRAVNPAWYAAKQALIRSLSPQDLASAQRHWQEEQASGEKRSFDDFMQHNFADMLIRGFLSPQSQGQEWVERKWPMSEQKAMDPLKKLMR